MCVCAVLLKLCGRSVNVSHTLYYWGTQFQYTHTGRDWMFLCTLYHWDITTMSLSGSLLHTNTKHTHTHTLSESDRKWQQCRLLSLHFQHLYLPAVMIVQTTSFSYSITPTATPWAAVPLYSPKNNKWYNFILNSTVFKPDTLNLTRLTTTNHKE